MKKKKDKNKKKKKKKKKKMRLFGQKAGLERIKLATSGLGSTFQSS